jgi:SAM-dependent methyltransferase
MQDEIFDRAARRSAHARMKRGTDDQHWLLNQMADDLCDRLAIITRPLSNALIIGHPQKRFATHLHQMGIRAIICNTHAQSAPDIVCDEDRLPFADASFDLVIACATLDTVNDLPGALVLVRRILRPDGVFLAAMNGAGSLATLKRCIASAAAKAGQTASARIHPQIDVRAAGDLLARAGFVMPVAELDDVTARYASMGALVKDIRAMGFSNVMTDRSPIGRLAAAMTAQTFLDLADAGGKVAETFATIYLTAWKPQLDAPTRRGPIKPKLPAPL